MVGGASALQTSQHGLSKATFLQWWGLDASELFAQYDSDHNKSLEWAEFASLLEEHLGVSDVDGRAALLQARVR